jgi:hypothetical protein
MQFDTAKDLYFPHIQHHGCGPPSFPFRLLNAFPENNEISHDASVVTS